MKLQTILEIAEDAIIADLCVKYYYETDDVKKQEIFEEIQNWYKKINKKE